MGDKVTIVGPPVKDYDGGWCNCWTDDMNHFIGKTVTIATIGDGGIRFKEIPYGWPAQALELPQTVKYTASVKVKLDEK